ncbi:MAG: deoxyribose-phosphate aldolase [Desulfobacterales bacterium]|nr:deoxyribose-phosphate aldolase [Desulfobacterales bacterium]
MKPSASDIARMIDFSIVRPEVDTTELQAFARSAKKYRFIGAYVLPYFVSELSALLEGEDDIMIGTGVGFPFGNNKTAVKVHEAKLALADGCQELDMVINISALLSGRYPYVEDDIRAVVDAAGGKTVKVILEVHYLTAFDIQKGCECCINAGAHFVKTATGNAESGATVENIALIKSFVGDAIQVKASGGVRDLKTLLEMNKLGATRFGISASSTLKIMEECDSLPAGLAKP